MVLLLHHPVTVYQYIYIYIIYLYITILKIIIATNHHQFIRNLPVTVVVLLIMIKYNIVI